MKIFTSLINKIFSKKIIFSTLSLIILLSFAKSDLYKDVSSGWRDIYDVYKRININYSDDLDPEVLSKAAIDGMLSKLDPYSTYLIEEDNHNLDIITKGNYGGVGIQLGVRNDTLTVISPMDNSPAQKAGIIKVSSKVFKETTLTISQNTNGSLAIGDKLTIAQATDDNLDRGIVYKTLIGNAAKTGFFGYDDSTTYFTFIADATNNAGVIGGSAGKAQFNTVKIDTGVNKGVAYYNAALELTRTVAAGTSDITTSHKILTSNGASGEPIWTTTVDGGTY